MPEFRVIITPPTEEAENREERPLVLMQNVPAQKYHQDLDCVTESGVTQQEYEESLLDRSLVITFHIFP